MKEIKRTEIEKSDELVLTLGGTDYVVYYDMKEMKTLSKSILLKSEIDAYGDTISMFFIGTQSTYAGMNPNLAEKVIDSAIKNKEYKVIDLYIKLKSYMSDRASELGFI